MGGMRRKMLVGILVACLCASGLGVVGSAMAASYDYEYLDKDGPDGGDMLGDALVARPLTFLASVVGAVTWVVSLPFTIVGGNASEAGDRLVVEPLRYTFVRPLGHMEEGTPPIYKQQQTADSR